MGSELQLRKELDKLRKNLLRMAALVEEGLQHAIRSLVQRDSPLARKVIAGDEEINQLENDINHHCMILLDSRETVDRDLRFITTAMRVATDLERVGDYAVNVARRGIALNEVPPLKPYVDMPKMAEVAQSMLRDVIRAFVNGDAKLARSVWERDDQVDSFDDQIFRELITYRISDANSVPRAIHLSIVSRCLERIADHATNIAEEIIYMIEGDVLRHQKKRKNW